MKPPKMIDPSLYVANLTPAVESSMINEDSNVSK